mmetsp:Transcript_2361/g.5349  ORF Transcript_2361/g.5349 Transcript_2361/m.5349 type:complete len:399 (+) Transcript_2361:276-1472(+)
MVTRKFCSDNDQTQSLADFANNSRRDVGAAGAATAKNGENTNASTGRRPSLASRAGALVRQMSSRATSSLAAVSAESQSQPLPPASAKMALFHTRTATVHVENGEWSLALKSYNRALIHHRQLHGQNSAPCATTLNGIGVCLMNLAIGGDSDEESILCRDYVRYAECALREALYIRERIFGTDSDEAEEVEINLELLLGPDWNDKGVEQQQHAGDAASRNSNSGSTPPSRSGSTDSLSGNNFQRAARRLFGSGGNDRDEDAAKRDHASRNPASGNDTASSSSASHSSNSSSLSSQEEQIDFQYPLGATLASMAKIRQSPPTSSSSSSNKSVDSSLHSTGSFGRTDDVNVDEEHLEDDDVAVHGVIDEIDLWALDDSSGDEMEQLPARACNVLFASASK